MFTPLISGGKFAPADLLHVVQHGEAEHLGVPLRALLAVLALAREGEAAGVVQWAGHVGLLRKV